MLVRQTAPAALVALGALVAACCSSAPTPTRVGPGSVSAPPVQDTAMSDTRAPIYPADQLEGWLDRHRSDPATIDEVELILPVLVTLTDNGMDVASATVGDDATALAIKVDDRMMGVPIAGKLPMFYGEGARTGMLWLRGLWRGGPPKTFEVRRVEGEIEDRAAATTAAIAE